MEKCQRGVVLRTPDLRAAKAAKGEANVQVKDGIEM
jgi:hypothetical protein